MTLVKTFKYELIKIAVFLFLFALTIFYVSSSQGEYYNSRPKQHYSVKDSTVAKNN